LDSELNISDQTFVGITDGDFKAVRYNDAGYRDSALNNTLGLETVDNGSTTMVTVNITDTDPMYGVALEVHYDTSKFTPDGTSFSGLIDSGIELASTRGTGVVSLGQVAESTAAREGEFATVVFKHSPDANRGASAVHTTAVDVVYEPPQLDAANHLAGFSTPDATVDDGTDATYSIFALFAQGDGSGDGATTIGDITPIAAFGNLQVAVSDTNYAPARTDYDFNGETNIADLTPLAVHLNEISPNLEVLLGDTDTHGICCW